MRSWISEHGFQKLAAVLLEPVDTIESNRKTWVACEHARLRTAVGRAYYAVFLSIKEKVTAVRLDHFFPKNDAHRKVREALEEVLGDRHPLVANLKALLRERKYADYELQLPLSASKALAVVHTGEDSLKLINQLSASAIAATANELFDIERRRGGASWSR